MIHDEKRTLKDQKRDGLNKGDLVLTELAIEPSP
jgi:hypothetical protein